MNAEDCEPAKGRVMFMTTEQVADATGAKVRTIFDWVEKGLIPRHCYAQIGRGPRRFLRVAVDYYGATGEWPPTVEVQQDWALKIKKAS